MRYTEITCTECSDLSGEENTRMVTIYGETSDLTLDEFIESFIRPLLSGMGYMEGTINEYLGEV